MATKGVLDKVVERVEIAVRPELRGEVADGETARAAGGQEIVAGEPDHFVVPLQDSIAASDNFGAKIERPGTGDGTLEDLDQSSVVNGREVFDDVHAQRIAVAFGAGLQSIHCPMCPLPTRFERRANDVAEGMVDHAVSGGGGARSIGAARGCPGNARRGSQNSFGGRRRGAEQATALFAAGPHMAMVVGWAIRTCEQDDSRRLPACFRFGVRTGRTRAIQRLPAASRKP